MSAHSKKSLLFGLIASLIFSISSVAYADVCPDLEKQPHDDISSWPLRTGKILPNVAYPFHHVKIARPGVLTGVIICFYGSDGKEAIGQGGKFAPRDRNRWPETSGGVECSESRTACIFTKG